MILKDHLNNLGIPTYVETKKTSEYIKKNDLPYAGGCYQGSREFIKEASKENDFKILIDIHRDSVSKKHTLYEKDGKKYARMQNQNLS